jgi:hypothetical protein
MRRFWSSFFWGPPSRKGIAWVGALAGIAVLALAGVVGGRAHPLFVLAVLLVGAAEFGWAAELLPRRWSAAAGWARLARWLCAAVGTIVAGACLLWGLTPAVWFGLIIAGTGVLLALEMAPNGPANRAK